jgi:hypothetical protein
MGHGLWFGTAKQRNVPIRALLRFGNVKLENVKVASVAGRWFRVASLLMKVSFQDGKWGENG